MRFRQAAAPVATRTAASIPSCKASPGPTATLDSARSGLSIRCRSSVSPSRSFRRTCSSDRGRTSVPDGDGEVMQAPERTTTLILASDAPEYSRALRERFPSVAFHPVTRYDDVVRAIAELRPEVALAFKIAGPFPRQPLLENKSLKWIHAGGAGVDHLAPWDAG